LAYKPDVDDFRESPAVEIVKLLALKNVDVVAYDPFLDQEIFETFTTATNLSEALLSAEFIIVLVRHKQFLELTPQKILRISQSNIIIDLVRCFDYEDWTAAGFKLYYLGN
jgi:UDP-N-acetyl-D-mannosaminuronate dehydrogenase